MRFSTIIIAAAWMLVIAPPSVFAQQKIIDDTYLISLYQAQQKRSEADPYVEKLIAAERARIRKLADQDVAGIIAQFDQKEESLALTKALDRQKVIVTTLQEYLRDRTVDLDLLAGEEKAYYLSPKGGSGAAPELRLSKSYPELLAKKAILEERIGALNAELSIQRDRLSKLSQQQRIEQYGSLLNFLTYVFIILGAILLDRFIRVRLERRMEQRSRGYVAAKFISAGIYLMALFWIIQRLLADNPVALVPVTIVVALIAVGLQDIVKDFLGWFVIIQRRLFALGQRVTIGAYTGEVVDIGILRTTLMEVDMSGSLRSHERTGRLLYLPNSLILREPTFNWNTVSDFTNAELRVSIAHGSDRKRTEKLLQDILDRETSQFVEQAQLQQRRRTALFYASALVSEPRVHTDLDNNGVIFTLTFTVPIALRRTVLTSLTKTILEAIQFTKDRGESFPEVRVAEGTES